MPEVTLPQGTVEYRETRPGSGPPVVFVHGALVDGSLWDGVGDRLGAAGMRTLAPTLPLGSHRIALGPKAERSPRGVAGLLLAFLDALDLHDVTLVGNDTGGAICQFAIDRDPSRVGRLVLTNCDAFDVFPPAPFDTGLRAATLPGVLRAGMAAMRLRRVRHSVLGYGGLVTEPLDPEQTRRWVEPARADAAVRADTRAFFGAVRPQDLADVGTRLGRFTKPVLLCWGPEDPFFTLALGRRLERAFPDARLVEIEGARTFVALDRPGRLADEVAAFAGQSGAKTVAPARFARASRG